MKKIPKFAKKYLAIRKVSKTIDSCETLEQLDVALEMLQNYGKMYGFDSYWEELNTKLINHNIPREAEYEILSDMERRSN